VFCADSIGFVSRKYGITRPKQFYPFASGLNQEACNISGQAVNLVARLAGTFNNPAPDGASVSLLLQFSDTVIQSTSSSSTLTITSSVGLLAGRINTSMRETNKNDASVVEFTLTNDCFDTGENRTTATVNAEVVSPSGVVLWLYSCGGIKLIKAKRCRPLSTHPP
jgi:hypothetical protein